MLLSIFFTCFWAICTSLEKCLFKIFFFCSLKNWIIWGGGLLSWWLSSKESICNAGNLQETRVLSLGQEDPQEKEPTLVFSPGKSHGQRSMAGCHPWGPEVSDMTEPSTLKLYFKKLGYLEPADFSCAHGCPVSQTFPASSTGRLIVRLTVPPGWNGKQFT